MFDRLSGSGLTVLIVFVTIQVASAESFVHWENAHVHPLEVTPDGTKLLAVNTADNRLEVFDISSETVVPLGSVPVGLDPVSVRAHENHVWVVNHISDSVSIVDLTSMNVVATIATADEPADVVFAGSPLRAFVSCSQVNLVQVFDPSDPSAPPIEIPIEAEEPRAMAVRPDGTTVYVAIFESGNNSTILGGSAASEDFFPPNMVSDPDGPYGGLNPPPNDGDQFSPTQNPDNSAPPPVGLIVKKNSDGQWLDDNNGNWTEFVSGPLAARSGRPVGWELVDRDVAVIDPTTLEVTYVRHLMNICMALAINPATGQVTVIGTDAINEVRFEPNLNGRFVTVNLALVPSDGTDPTVIDLNPHLDYTTPTIPQAQRDLSIGDPRGLVWNAAGTRGYVTGMGSNNVVVIDSAGQRAGLSPTIEVGEGPTGLVLDEANGRLFVMNKFDGSISVIDTRTETEVSRVPFFDPTPASIRNGRQHLYGTHETSGLGQVSCASCHVDARMDRLAWDLGNPAGEMKEFNQNCNFGSFGDFAEVLGTEPCPDWHPMKGPMVTQTFQDIIGKEPHHWRGDRDGLEEFNPTFLNLQGDDEVLTAEQMQQFEDFLATISFPPNPFRGFDNSLPSDLALPDQFFTGIGGEPGEPLPNGDAVFALGAFFEHHLVPTFGISCSHCHTTPAGLGTNFVLHVHESQLIELDGPFPEGPNGELHHAVIFSPQAETTNISIKIPHLRNLHEKIGFEMTQTSSLAGFGFLHDGSVDSLARFMAEPAFIFDEGADGPPEELIPGMVALMMAFSGSDLPLEIGIPIGVPGTMSHDTHAAVGTQVTLNAANQNDPTTIAQLSAMIDLLEQEPDDIPGPEVALVAKGIGDDLQRGYYYLGAQTLQSDRQAESITVDELRLAVRAGSEVTFTIVPAGTEVRIGVDRDEDGFFDRDELDAGSDPADACSGPAGEVPQGDADVDGDVDLFDYEAFVACVGSPSQSVDDSCACTFDSDDDGDVDLIDFAAFQRAFTGG